MQAKEASKALGRSHRTMRLFDCSYGLRPYRNYPHSTNETPDVFPDAGLRSVAQLLPVPPNGLPSQRLLELPATVPLDVPVQPPGELLERHADPVPPVEEVALRRPEEPLAPRVVGTPRLARHRDMALVAGRGPAPAHAGRPSVAVDDQRTPRRGARGRHEVAQRADHEPPSGWRDSLRHTGQPSKQ